MRFTLVFPVLCAVLLPGPVARAAEPFNTATVTRLENRVSFGERRAGRNVTRPAVEADVLRGNNFLLSQENSRAELQYPDGTLVRVGQNSVFSFDPATRTLELQKGTMLMNMPRGAGGGTIKTPSITAAISGTTLKVSPTVIAVIEGSVRLVPSGRTVRAGEFARRNPDGSITIAAFDPARQDEGRLVNWGEKMPGFPERLLAATGPTAPGMTNIERELRALEVLHRSQNLPNSIDRFFDVSPRGNRGRDRDDDDEVDAPQQFVPTPPRRVPPPRTPPPVSPSPGPFLPIPSEGF